MNFVLPAGQIRQIKPITNLLIVSFLTLKSLLLPLEKCFLDEFLVANVSLNGFTCGLDTVFNYSNPSQKVTQKVKTVMYLFTVEFIDGNFIHFIF